MPEFTEDQLRYHAAKAGWPANDLAAELLRMRTAMTAALRELGVPTIGYPAPVANAVDILEAALEGEIDATTTR